ncbi:aryl-sulfate sulfotransferase [Blautia sp.]|uniref:aryl-sulfate sulfotransferase n=1 Tax=Blautia sp. TaxID=1955243 RepID=UPI003AF4E3D9
MKKRNIRKVIIVIIVAAVFLIVLGIVGWKKRIGIYNTYMRMTGREPSYRVQQILKGGDLSYHKSVIKTDTEEQEVLQIEDNGNSDKKVEASIPVEESWVDESKEIDRQIEEERKNGYTWEEPLVVQNPFKYSPLTAVILFDTEEECEVRVTVKGKTEAADITGTTDAAVSHRVPVIGLYPGQENTVVLELLDASGKTTDSKEIKITTDELPESMAQAVTVVKSSGESAIPLTMVYGQRVRYSYAYDCMGDVRWYMSRKTNKFGIHPLSGGKFLFADADIGNVNVSRPDATDFYETDYLGRAYQLYYIANGAHHDITEKEPGGNFMILTNSGETYYWDMVQEIDRETGEVVNELKLNELFHNKYATQIDWAHLNTVSYQPDEDTVLISVRNLSSVVKVNWTTKEIVWILGGTEIWKGTEFEKYVLKADGDFIEHFYQHSTYQLEQNLDGNPETQEICMFDNHSSFFKSRIKDYYDDPGESYILVYSVDPEKRTVKQIKKLPMVYSHITSNAFYDEASNHIFGICGYGGETTGMTYEFDYDTGEIINQYQISASFYRAVPMELNYDELAAKMETRENYICGELFKPVETEKKVSKKASKTVEESDVSMRIMNRVLYVNSEYHAISQIIFEGNDHTYVYDLSKFRLYEEALLKLRQDTPVPLQEMKEDSYHVYVVYKNEFCDTAQTITIK